MEMKVEKTALDALKGQMDAALRVIGAICESSRKIREAQLQAAVEAHAAIEAMRKRLASTTQVEELWKLQQEFASANLERSLGYWRKLWQTALETQLSAARGLGQPGSLAVPAAPFPWESKAALVDVIDNVYQRWLEATRQFYTAPAVSAPQIRHPS